MAVAEDEQLVWLDTLLKKHYTSKSSIVGPGKDATPEARILGRIIRYCDWGIQYEPDPVHVETILRELGMEDARPIGSPSAETSSVGEVISSGAGLAERRRAVGSQKALPLKVPETEYLP